ncbi:MAG: winged helix-turn-helix domain-containing protein [Xanthomonadales bacterium]|nr:hypothetical protein [Xanthomonadales bacterium]MCC6592075.1 winged helix-turn-helix domain-containing protein [Xanthomonadales bacterium]
MNYRFANFRLDPIARRLTRDELALEVPRRVFDCLVYLIEQRARAVGRDELIEYVWRRSNVSDNQLAQTVLAARRLLDDDGAQQRLIRTVSGFGYHFVGEVQVEAAQTSAAETGTAPLATPAPETMPASEAMPARATPPAPAAAAPRIRPGLAAALSLALLASGWALWRTREWPASLESPVQPAPAPAPGWVWVLPARVAPGEEEWARIGIATLIAERLRHRGTVVVPMENVLSRLHDRTPGNDLGALQRELGASRLVLPTVHREGEGWRVELRVQGAGWPLHVAVNDADLLLAARKATDQLDTPSPDAIAASDEGFDMIEQLIRSRDFEAALGQLAQLREPQSPEAELLRIRLDMEQGRHAQAEERAAGLRARLDPQLEPVQTGRLDMLEVSLLRRRGAPGWEALIDQAVVLLQAHGRPRDLGRALILRGSRAAAAGEYAAASMDFTQAQRHFLADADELGAASAGELLAMIASLQGRPAEALRQVQDSVETFARYGAVGQQFLGLRGMLSLQFGMLRWDDAQVTLERMRALQAQSADSDERTDYLRARMLLLLGTGQLREAHALLEESEREPSRARASADVLRTADLYRMQLDLARGRHAQVAVDGAAAYARVYSEDGKESVSTSHRDQGELALYLWFEARRRLRAEAPLALPPLAALPKTLQAPATTFGWLARGHHLREGGNGRGIEAEDAYREALRLAHALNRQSRIVAANEALIRLLLEQGRTAVAAQELTDLLASDPGLPARDFDSAVLLMRVRRAEGDLPGWRRAAADAARLAGERQIPPELLEPPPG